MAFIYRHIRHDTNEVFYVGMGFDNSLKRAYIKSNRSQEWKNIVSKTTYDIEILFENLSMEEGFKKEMEFIKLYGRRDKNAGTLTNKTDGGRGGLGRRMSPEHRQKLSALMQGNKRGEGVIFSEERRRKHSLNALGNQHWVGKTHNEETRKKLREINIGNQHWSGKRHKPESKAKLSEARKKIILNTDTGIFYLGIAEAAFYHNLNNHTLSSYLTKKFKNKTSLIYV